MSSPKYHQVVKLLGARLQVIETSLNLAESAGGALGQFFLEQATQSLTSTKEVLTECLSDLTEWQVSAFHDQYNLLTERANALTTTTKEN